MFVGHVDTGGVGSLGAVQITRQRDARVRQADGAFLRGHLLDLFYEWTPDAATRHRILVDNPARLYGFPN